LAEALLRTGILYSVAGQRDLAETTLAEGYWTALAAGHDRFAVANAIQLIMVVGTQPGRLDDGIAWGQHASALIERSDIAPVQEGHLLNNLGLTLYLQGRHEDALESFDSALEIQTATLGPEDPELANIHNNKGNALVELDQLSLAATEYERAIDIRVKALGPDHPRLISSLGNLGAVQLRRDEIESARASFERALALTSEALGDRHPRAIGLISNLGSLEVEAGHEHRAIELFERSVALAAEADRPYDAALALTNLGLIYADRGELERARSSLQRAFDLTREALGDEHAETLRRRGYLADVARREGRLETARAELSLVIARLEESTSREHPSLAFPLWSLAELELGRGDSAAASAHTGRGLDVLGDTGTQTGLRARLQFTQARVHLLDHDLASARRLGEQARATLDAGVAGSDARFRARLDQWLATAGPE
jgi:tetratricopeptide (TPR) repeat protein